MLDALSAVFPRLRCRGEYWSVRAVDERAESLAVRRDVALPPELSQDRGAMVTVVAGSGVGYAATADLGLAGLQGALDRATRWAEATARFSAIEASALERASATGEYDSPGFGAADWSRAEWYERLRAESAAARVDARIVDWTAGVDRSSIEQVLLSSAGARIVQRFRLLMPDVTVTAHEGGETQTRTLHGRGVCQQGGLEILDRFGFCGAVRRAADEALALLAAPNCPSGTMDLLLMPDQMMLQIHESIGHPLELDRILGDERNYAGTSFVTPEMFGTYRYGSELLDVTFDPTRPEQLASYGFDDDGTPARREHVIRRGLLLRPLGSALSQRRSGLAGVANSRADGWARPPIDRMANLNVEPGESTFDDLVSSVDRGVLMSANRSWSIDDARNKFQFGCEVGRLIENGRLRALVKNPNYRGISAGFWRSLRAVGDASTVQVLGTPYCGKGEPSQIIRVGHASPACVFAGVDVFGGVA